MNPILQSFDAVVASPASSFWMGVIGLCISIATLLAANKARDAANKATEKFSKLDMINDLNKAQERSYSLKEAIDKNEAGIALTLINEIRPLLVSISEITTIDDHRKEINLFLSYLSSTEMAVKNDISQVGSEEITNYSTQLQRIGIREKVGVLNGRQ